MILRRVSPASHGQNAISDETTGIFVVDGPGARNHLADERMGQLNTRFAQLMSHSTRSRLRS